MNVFEFVIAIMMITTLASIIHQIIRAKTTARSQGWNDRMAQWGEVEERLGRLEKRMANLETIVLEGEKARQFERELK